MIHFVRIIINLGVRVNIAKSALPPTEVKSVQKRQKYTLLESTRTRCRPTLQPNLIRFLCLRLVVTLTHHRLTRAPAEHRQCSLLLFGKLVLGFFKRLR